jgi:hypothetical protein
MDETTVATIAAANGYTLPPGRAEAIATATGASLALFDDTARNLRFEAEPSDYAAAVAEGAGR